MFFFTLQLSFSFLLNFKKKSRERNIFFLSFFTVLIQHKKDLFHLSARRGKKNAARSANKRIIQEEFGEGGGGGAKKKFFHYFHMNEILFAIMSTNEGNRGNIIISRMSDDKVFKFLGFMEDETNIYTFFCYSNRKKCSLYFKYNNPYFLN